MPPGPDGITITLSNNGRAWSGRPCASAARARTSSIAATGAFCSPKWRSKMAWARSARSCASVKLACSRRTLARLAKPHAVHSWVSPNLFRPARACVALAPQPRSICRRCAAPRPGATASARPRDARHRAGVPAPRAPDGATPRRKQVAALDHHLAERSHRGGGLGMVGAKRAFAHLAARAGTLARPHRDGRLVTAAAR